MNITGVLVHARPDKLAGVKASLQTLPGVEIHATTDTGRLVLTVEQDDDRLMADTVMGLHRVDGVLSAAMIYHHYEPDEPSEQEASK